MERNVLVGGTVINTHEIGECSGQYCTIHNRSNHHMSKWKQIWDEPNRRMMRVCSHNVAHLDPDEVSSALREHYCDGCCNPSFQFEDDFNELTKTYILETIRRDKSTGRILDI